MSQPHKYSNLPPNRTNPGNQPTGHFTGRCGKCGSNDLWDDNLNYGCNNCGAIFFFCSHIQPRLVLNGNR